MTIGNIKPPNEFDFTRSADWPRWLNCFELYQEVSEISEKPARKQVFSLLYHIGETAIEIYDSFKLSEADKNNYVKVVESSTRSRTQRNVIYERAMFYNRQQKEG